MKTKTLRSFEEVMHMLSSIPYINCGGCGISALAMYVWLKKHKRTAPKIFFCYRGSYGKSTYENNVNRIKSGKTCLEVPNHVVIEYRRKKYDSDGHYVEFKKTYKWYHEVDLEKLVSTVKKEDGWNPVFDRKNVKKIEKWIDSRLPIHRYDKIVDWIQLTLF